MPNDTPQRLAGLREAATASGKSEQTLRRMIKRRVITGYRDGTSAVSPILVDLDELEAVTKPKPIAV